MAGTHVIKIEQIRNHDRGTQQRKTTLTEQT